MKNRFRSVVLACVVPTLTLYTVAAGPSEFHTARADQCRLEDTVKRRLPDHARVELLLSAGNTVPSGRRASYAAMAHAIFACAGNDARVELVPITDEGIGVAPVLIETIPSGKGVPLQDSLRKEHLLKDIDVQIAGVLNPRKEFAHFDPIGTLYAAGETLHRVQRGDKRVVVVIGNGWQQTSDINVYRYRDNLEARADEVIKLLRNSGTLPDLSGIDVIMAGFASGYQGMDMRPRDMVRLCRFWKKIIAAAGGSMPLPCSQVLPGLTMPL
jgi:hypothetical protein